MASIASVASIRNFIFTCLSGNAEINGTSFDEETEKYFEIMEILFKGRELYSATFGLFKPELRKSFEKYFDKKLERISLPKKNTRLNPKNFLTDTLPSFRLKPDTV